MRERYRLITNLKIADVCLQITCFLFMTCTFLIDENVFGYSVAIMALEQCLSTLYWLFFLREPVPKIGGGVFIRNAFCFTMIGLLFCSFFEGEIMLIVLISMIVIGPMLGLTYFTITVAEIYFYKNRIKKEEGSCIQEPSSK
jgi:hypothetical protein